MNIVIIKYNAGNVQSVSFALERLGLVAEITNDIEKIRSADKLIFPGVGEAGSAMNFLRKRNLDACIKDLKQPVLGVCLGMQLLCRRTEEANTGCLGVFDVDVKKFRGSMKIPHVGWNKIETRNKQLFSGIATESYCYFVHSYYAELCDETAALTEYGSGFSSALQKNNFYGVQFHPEKSGEVGQKILKNFLEL